MKPWTLNYLSWVKHEVHFEQMAQEATLLDYPHEVEHAEGRIARLDLAIEEAVKLTPPQMRAVIEALQALRGVARVGAATIVAEPFSTGMFAPRSGLLRASTPRVTDQTPQGQSRKAGLPSRPNTGRGLTSSSF